MDVPGSILLPAGVLEDSHFKTAIVLVNERPENQPVNARNYLCREVANSSICSLFKWTDTAVCRFGAEVIPAQSYGSKCYLWSGQLLLFVVQGCRCCGRHVNSSWHRLRIMVLPSCASVWMRKLTGRILKTSGSGPGGVYCDAKANNSNCLLTAVGLRVIMYDYIG